MPLSKDLPPTYPRARYPPGLILQTIHLHLHHLHLLPVLHHRLHLVFQGPVRSGFLAFFGQDRDRTGLQKFPFWEKTEPDWEKPVYIGPVLNICQL